MGKRAERVEWKEREAKEGEIANERRKTEQKKKAQAARRK